MIFVVLIIYTTRRRKSQGGNGKYSAFDTVAGDFGCGDAGAEVVLAGGEIQQNEGFEREDGHQRKNRLLWKRNIFFCNSSCQKLKKKSSVFFSFGI